MNSSPNGRIVFKKRKVNQAIRKRTSDYDENELPVICPKSDSFQHSLESYSVENAAVNCVTSVSYNSKRSSFPDGPVDQGATRYFETDHSSSSKGIIKKPVFLRTTVRWDYQPDICKDFKETGFCGFGDSCIFLHDRSDYKFGWQLEGRKRRVNDCEDDKFEIFPPVEISLDKCFICKDSFRDPVVTKCKHFFCQKCALDYYRDNTRCPICGAQTEGIFKCAKNV